MNRVIKQTLVAPSNDVFHVPAEGGLNPFTGQESAGQSEQDAALREALQKRDAALREAEAAKQETEELSRRILRSANAEAEKITRTAHEKAEALRTASRQEGYAEALRAKADEIDACIRRVDRVLAEMSERQSRFFADYDAELESLAVNVAEKILARRVEEDPTQMAELVMQAVGTVRTDDWITVELSDQLPELVGYLQKEYAAYLSKRQVEFSTEDMPKGACLIQTATGVTDASIATQLGNLRELMKMGETAQ